MKRAPGALRVGPLLPDREEEKRNSLHDGVKREVGWPPDPFLLVPRTFGPR